MINRKMVPSMVLVALLGVSCIAMENQTVTQQSTAAPDLLAAISKNHTEYKDQLTQLKAQLLNKRTRVRRIAIATGVGFGIMAAVTSYLLCQNINANYFDLASKLSPAAAGGIVGLLSGLVSQQGTYSVGKLFSSLKNIKQGINDLQLRYAEKDHTLLQEIETVFPRHHQQELALLQQNLAMAQAAQKQAEDTTAAARATYEAQLQTIQVQHQEELRVANEKYQQELVQLQQNLVVAQAAQKQEADTAATARAAYEAQLQTVQVQHQEELRVANEKYQQELAQLQQGLAAAHATQTQEAETTSTEPLPADASREVSRIQNESEEKPQESKHHHHFPHFGKKPPKDKEQKASAAQQEGDELES